MGIETTNASADINTIPYDAPVAFPNPSWWWIQKQNWNGNKGKFVTVLDADLKDKWVIISGSNSGIGREAALQMYFPPFAMARPSPHAAQTSTSLTN